MATNARRVSANQAGAARDKAQEAGSQVQQSSAYRRLVSLGLICYGVIHLLLGWLCVQIALGGGGEASTDGALKDLVSKPFGNVLMVVFAIGLFALVVWQVIEALFGYRNRRTSEMVRKRISSAGKAVVYAALGVTAIALARGGNSTSSNESAQSASATLMSAPLGQFLVVLLGAIVMAVGIGQVVKGVRRKFVTDDLRPGVPEGAKKLGIVGWCIKGVSIALVGLLFVWAGVTFDPNKAGGVDGALQTLRDQPFGMILLILMGLGFACFGVYCFVWSRNVNHENI